MVKIDRLEERGDVVLYDVGSACEYFHRTKVRKDWECATCGVSIPKGSYAMVRNIEDIQVGHFCTSERIHYCEECGEKEIKQEVDEAETRGFFIREEKNKETPAEYTARRLKLDKSRRETPEEYNARKRGVEMTELFAGKKIILGLR